MTSAPFIGRAVRRVIVLDTETTGFQTFDRMICLGAVRFEGEAMCGELHRVYDPRKDSHPDAAAVHGWDDWTLRFQPLFADEANEVREWLGWADLLVMHNAAFDMRFLEREIRKADAPPLEIETFCTMEEARRLWNGPAKLDHCIARIGLARSGKRHGAFEDALLTASLYFHQTGSSYRPQLPATWPAPTNFTLPPERPAGQLPRRTTKKKAATTVRASPPLVNQDIQAYRDRWRDAFTVLQHLAIIGNATSETHIKAVICFIACCREGPALDLEDELLLIQFALELPGTRGDAIEAARRLFGLQDQIVALSPLIVQMIKADGQTTSDETEAARLIIAAIRHGPLT